MESIYDYTFVNTAIIDAKLNEGLTHLGYLCFSTESLSEIYIPSSVTVLDMPFYPNTDKTLKVISTAGSEAEKYVELDGQAFNIVFEAQ